MPTTQLHISLSNAFSLLYKTFLDTISIKSDKDVNTIVIDKDVYVVKSGGTTFRSWNVGHENINEDWIIIIIIPIIIVWLNNYNIGYGYGSEANKNQFAKYHPWVACYLCR